jgi:hypothetical protein
MRRGRSTVAAIAALWVVALVPAPASASDLTKSGSTLTYTAADGEQNNVDVDTSAGGHVLISDSGATIAVLTAACTPIDAHSADCGVPSAGGYSGVSLALGDEIDVSDFHDGLPLSSRVADGGADNDVLNGSAQADTLMGGADHDNLNGEDGANHLLGGGGEDTIDATGTGHDTVDAGAGADKVFTRDTSADAVACGSEVDRVDADVSDAVGQDCEQDADGNPFSHGPEVSTATPLVNDDATVFRGSVFVKQPPWSSHFEWGLTRSYGFSVAAPPGGTSATGQHAVSASYNRRLLPGGRPLHARLVASDSTGSRAGGDVTFAEPNAPIVFELPGVVTGDVHSADTASGSLPFQDCAGSCNAGYSAEPRTIHLPLVLASGRGDRSAGAGAAVTGVGPLGPPIPPRARLLYGPTEDYGETTGTVLATGAEPPTLPDLTDSSRSASLAFDVHGLKPATAYRGSLLATTYGGFNQSRDFTFATPAGRSGGTGTATISSGATGGGATATMTLQYTCIGVGDQPCGGSAEDDSTYTFSSAANGAAAKRRSRIVIARGKFRVRAHHQGKIRLKLTRRGRKLVRRHRKLKTQVVYRTRGRHGRILRTATPLVVKRRLK